MSDTALDDFTDLSAWTAVASGLAHLEISQDQGPHGKAMRLDFDFKGGGGFVVARKMFSLPLPEAYAFSFNLRGSAPANKFEFKLIDPLNQNVWWYHRDTFDFPADWQPFQIRSSRIEFAWGPAGGGPMPEVGALEFVIAAGPGGRGTVWIDDLRFADHSVRAAPRVQASSALPGHEPARAVDRNGATCWRSEPTSVPQWLLVDFQAEREYGGVVIQWEPDAWARAFEIQTSNDAREWQTVYAAPQAAGERSYIPLPNGLSRYLRLNLLRAGDGRGFGIIDLDIKPYDFSRSINAFFQAIAQRETRGLFPKYLTGEQTYWTPVGIAESRTQGLLNEEGMVEVDKGSFSIEPFLYLDDKLITWADARISQHLEKGYLPIPSSIWRMDDMVLTTTAFATGGPEQAVLYIRYRIENSGRSARQVSLFAALRPFQVTPPWQSFNQFGGVSPIRELTLRGDSVWVNGDKAVMSLTQPTRFSAAGFDQGAITHWMKTGILPYRTQVSDGFGYASGALRYDLPLGPGLAQEVYLAIPLGAADGTGGEWAEGPPAGLEGAAQFDIAKREWERKLGSLDIRLPPSAQGFTDTLKTAAAHILINRNGPALQPGPRRYTRSWIRDGATMAAALLRMGWTGEVRDFIRWYARYQAADGNVPCAVDHNGADWLPEHDSHGELIYTVMEYFRFSGDHELLAECRPAIVKAVDYIEALRNQRLTAEFATAEKRTCYGLLPESVSHEGYLAHPVHAYWDDFWALRGLKDAAAIAQILGEQNPARRCAELRDAFREALYASIQATMQERGVEYIPASVEWADCDPAATAVAITLDADLEQLPAAAVEHTFSEFLARFRAMHGGAVEWTHYTPYEIRIIGALVRLGKRREAHELIEFFLSDRRPTAWNQWPEIAWRDPKTPGHLGDLPHTWIGAEYILACRALLAYEREADQSLVLAAGIPDAWLDETEGIAVNDLPTYYGTLSYSLRRAGADALQLALSGECAIPPGGIVVRPPLSLPLAHVEVNGEAIDTFDAESITLDRCPADVVMQTRI